MPSRSGGFGSATQVNIPHDPAMTATRSVLRNHRRCNTVIPRSRQRPRDLAHVVCDTQMTERDPPPWVRSLTSFGMTRILPSLARDSFGHRNFPAHAAPFYSAIIHRLREDRRDNELAAITRLDVVIDLQ